MEMLEQRLNNLFKESIKQITPLYGGQMAKVYAVELFSKQKLVAKVGEKLELEASTAIPAPPENAVRDI